MQDHVLNDDNIIFFVLHLQRLNFFKTFILSSLFLFIHNSIIFFKHSLNHFDFVIKIKKRFKLWLSVAYFQSK